MVMLYTSTGRYILRRNNKGLKFPVVMMAGKEYHLSVAEMILWTKGMWNICSHELLKDLFKQEEKVLGEMNFDFILNRLVQRGLILSGEAQSDVEALHTLIGDLTINSGNVSLFSQVTAFLNMVFLMKIPASKARTVFRKYELTDDEKLVMKFTHNNDMTAAELINCLDMDNASALVLISNLYLRKLINFSSRKECL